MPVGPAWKRSLPLGCRVFDGNLLFSIIVLSKEAVLVNLSRIVSLCWCSGLPVILCCYLIKGDAGLKSRLPLKHQITPGMLESKQHPLFSHTCRLIPPHPQSWRLWGATEQISTINKTCKIITRQVFSLARNCSKRVTCLSMPQLKKQYHERSFKFLCKKYNGITKVHPLINRITFERQIGINSITKRSMIFSDFPPK